MSRFVPLALAMLLLVAGCAQERPVEVHGTVERDRLELIAESNERIVEIVVHEGDRVPAGTVLVRQEAGIAQPRIDQSRAAVLEAQRRLADLEQGPRQREIDEARATLGGAESELQTAQSEFARVQTLVQRKLLSQSNLDQARAARDSARAARDAARARYELLQQGTRTEQVAAARAAVQRATAALAEVETVAARHTVTAPRAGLVEALPYKLGERPAAGTAGRDPARRRRAVRARLRARTAAHAVHGRRARRSDRRRPRGAAHGHGALRLGGGGIHAVLRPDAEGSLATRVPRRDHARRSGRAGLPAGVPVQVFVPAARP